ncbi:putative membrane protein [Nocardiopsis mwathae]|uniref:Putative membrane protein n=1 Tax=Nocardiopsis mwathae TaxID=1472723 RepID=A0A7X0D3Z3_9ACTN|nr:YhgE/Pip domain-containing protein [Nocardiopsis mwathae]MBB6170241.1 putative membrane protein [Nocardiopsis mwathae]
MTRPRLRLLPTLRIAWLSVRSFFRAPLPLAALIALALVPLLYSGLYLWAFWDPFGRMSSLPVALVNEDEPATADGEELRAGDDLTDELLRRGDLDWHLVEADEAADGVAAGRYYVSLTIPHDFSADLATPSDEEALPIPARLRAHYNDANSYIVRELLAAAFKEIQSAAGRTATEDYLERMFLGFNDIHDETEEAADGAGRLADGTDDAKDGSRRLHDGLGDAEEGADELGSGIGDLYDGSRELADGATAVSGEVADATARLDTLADEWVPVLRTDTPAIESTARSVATAASTLSAALGRLPDCCAQGVVRAEGIRDRLRDHLAAHPDLEQDDPELHTLLTEARQVAERAVRLNAFVRDSGGQIADVKRKADRVAALASALARDAPTLADDAEAARDKVDALDAALADIARGSRDLRDGLASADSGAKDLDEGIRDLHSGAGDLDEGIGELRDGAHELADGLVEGADDIPTFDAADRRDRGNMMSEPVRLSSTIDNEAPDYGTGFAPFFIALSLWVGAMVIYIVLPPLSGRGLASTAPSWRIALAGWLPGFAIATAQVVLMLGVLHLGLGLQARHWPGVVGVLVLAAGAFTAVVHFLVARFGAVGKGVALVLLMLQLTSAGGTYPIETSPVFFREVGPYLPMSHVVEALRHLISGGELTAVWEAVRVLTAYLVGALVLSWMSVERRRTWSMKDLHPPLKI